MELIVRTVTPMLESGLPCFKENTIKNLRQRFVPSKSEKEAALYFRKLIKNLWKVSILKVTMSSKDSPMVFHIKQYYTYIISYIH